MPVLAWLLAPGLPLDEAVAGRCGPVRVDAGAAGRDRRPPPAGPAVPPVSTSRSTPACPGAVRRRRLARAVRGRGQGRRRTATSRSSGCGATSSTPTCPITPRTTVSSTPSTTASPPPSGSGSTRRYRHLANSAATLTRPDTHFDLVRPGIAVLRALAGARDGLRAAAGDDRTGAGAADQAGAGRAGRVVRTHLHHRRGRPPWRWSRSGTPTGCRARPATSGPVRLAGANRTIAGRVCMDQIVVDCGDDPVRPVTWPSSLDRATTANPPRTTGPRRSAPSTTRS